MSSGSALTPAQRLALAHMGIDVWVRRARTPGPPARSSTESSARSDAREAKTSRRRGPPRAMHTEFAATPRIEPAPTEMIQPVTTQPAPAAIATRDADATGAPFRACLDCVAVRGAVVIGTFVHPLDKRLAHDVALAVAGSVGADSTTQHTQFRWPATQTGDQSIGAARSAYRAFVRGQRDRNSAHAVVVCGAAACGLLTDDDRVIRAPELAELRADPHAKKELWRNVSKRVRG